MDRYPGQRSETATSLHGERLDAVIRRLRESNAESVLDLGCGPGELLARLAGESRIRKIAGLDNSQEALAAARQRLAREGRRDDRRLCLYHASFTSFIEELVGFDAAVLVETIEHIDPQRLSAVEQVVFSGYRPKTVLITTPNCEYNVLHGVRPGVFRHYDHRFEWSRAKFRGWAEGVAGRNEYRVTFDDIGEVDPVLGSSTQMATFSRG